MRYYFVKQLFFMLVRQTNVLPYLLHTVAMNDFLHLSAPPYKQHHNWGKYCKQLMKWMRPSLNHTLLYNKPRSASVVSLLLHRVYSSSDKMLNKNKMTVNNIMSTNWTWQLSPSPISPWFKSQVLNAKGGLGALRSHAWPFTLFAWLTHTGPRCDQKCGLWWWSTNSRQTKLTIGWHLRTQKIKSSSMVFKWCQWV